MKLDADKAIRRSDAVVDVLVLGFGLATLCAHAAVFSGANLHGLLLALPLAIAGAPLLALRMARAERNEARSAPPSQSGGDAEPPLALRAAVALGAAACTAAFLAGAPLAACWLAALATAAVCALRELFAPAPAAAAAAECRGGHFALLAALALVCLVVTLGSNRPDADDAFYLNLAVAAVDDPERPLLAGDTLHGESDVPLPLPIYRVHSLELLQAAVAWATGRPVLDVAHLAFPAVAALLVPLAWGRLARRLLPVSWPWATAVAVGVLLFFATASHGWSNFGLVRLHQGKALVLAIALPLTAAYALEFAARGGVPAWLRLALVQIGAVGASASALWLAPAVAALALLAGSGGARDGRGLVRVAKGLAASGYVAVLALALRSGTAAAFRDAGVASPELALAGDELARQALRVVIGPGLPGALALFAGLGAWAFARTAVARRLCAFSAAATLLLWNPFAAQAIAANVTGAPTYWRVLWLLPVPLLLGIVVASPVEHAGRSRARLSRAVAAGLAALFFGASVARDSGAFAASPANHVAFGWPSWKLPRAELEAASAIVAATGPEARVLAPRGVAPWIAALHGHPDPLVVRIEYLPVLHAKLGDDELRRRAQLLRLVSGSRRPPRAVDLLRSSLAEDRLAAVCLSRSVQRWPDVVAVLADAGFQKIREDADYEIWKSPLW